MRALRLGRHLALSCLLTIPSTVCAEQLPIKTYTAADGLAQNLVLRIVPDSRGYLWFCTGEGLSRFDGYSFTNYTTDHGLPHRSVRDLLETRNATFWIATGDGLVRFNPNARRSSNSGEPMFVTYHPDESQPARSISVLYEDPGGTVWCGTMGGLYRLEDVNGQVKFHFVEMGMRNVWDESFVEDILEDRRGALWVGTRGSGLYRRLPDGRVEQYGAKHGLPALRVNTLIEDRQGRLWAGTSLGLCLLVEEPKPDRLVVARVFRRDTFGLPGEWIEALFQSSDGRFWIGLAGGLSELLPASEGLELKFRSYATAQGLSYLDLTSLAEDSAGNLWIGATAGVMKLAQNGFVTYTNPTGSTPIGAGGIVETKAGELCFISQSSNASALAMIRLDTKDPSVVWPNFPKQITYFGFGWNQIGLQDRKGEYWLATGQGLCRFPAVNRVEQLAHTRPKAVYTKKNGLMHDLVWRIFEDSRGDIWIATTSAWIGITRWERATDTFHHYSQKEGLPSEGWPTAFAEDSGGNVWIAMSHTLVRYNQGKFKLFTTSHGLPKGPINAFHTDALGRLWIGSDAGGLSRVDDPKINDPVFTNYTTAKGLSSNQVWCITSDQSGNIYAFTGRGVDCLNPTTERVKHYTTADGLVGGAPKTAFCDRHGTLWFGTDLGFSRFTPQPDSSPARLPILISGLRVGGDRRPLSELGETEVPEVKLNPNENQIQIDFVGLNFSIGEQLKYEYKLEGTDADWSSPTVQRSVNFAHLSPGSYRFVVRAVGSDGSMSQSPARVSLTILPPIWQRWWFVSLVSILLMVSAYFAYRYRLNRLLELERIRTRIATDLHDDIGSNLSLIAMVSEVAHRGRQPVDSQMAAWLSLIANTSRETVDSMSDIVWAINPAKDRLFDLTQRMRRVADDILSARNIRFTFSVPGKEADKYLGADTRREVFMIFKEALNNIGRHSNSTQVELVLSAEDKRLILKVSDNGSGFDPSTVADGNGLASMRRRAQNLNAELSITSAEGTGTSVTLSLPLNGRRTV